MFEKAKREIGFSRNPENLYMGPNKIITLASLLALSSCSQLSLKKPVALKANEFSFNPTRELGISGENIADLVVSAKEKGPGAMEFLATDLYLKGNDAAIRGESQIAVFYFKYAVELAPEDTFIQKKFAYELIRIGDVTQAEPILEVLFKKSKYKDEIIGQVLGGVYSTLEKTSKATDTYKKILAINPASEDTCLYLSRVYVAEKKFEDVHSLLSKCEVASGNNPVFSFFRGKMEYDRKHKEIAKKYFEKSLKADPTYSQGALAIGALFEEKEDFESAIKTYKNFLKDEDNTYDAPVLQRLVTVLLSMERNKEVIPYAEKMLVSESADLNIKVRLGLLYSDENRFDDAIALFKTILTEVPTSDKIQYYLGALYQQKNQFDEAIRFYNLINSESPLYGDAGIQIGQLLSSMAKESFPKSMLGPSEKFSQYIEERVKLNPEMSVELKMLKASFYEDTMQFKKAVEALDSVKSHKNFSENHRYYFASLLERSGDYKEARILIKQILEKDPNNAHALNFLGYSYLERNENMDEAYEYISKAVKLNPTDGYIRDSLAWYFFQVGKYNEALAEAVKANELTNGDVTITKHLGMIYQKLNHYDKAHQYLTEALSKTQAQTDREDVLKHLTELEFKRSPASVP